MGHDLLLPRATIVLTLKMPVRTYAINHLKMIIIKLIYVVVTTSSTTLLMIHAC